jgi:hypothetical protein
MNPLAKGEAQRTTFLVKDLLYVPRTVYQVLDKTLSPIKGHNSETKEVVGVMKNFLFHMIHGTPINIHDFFLRTLVTVAQSPRDLKPYAPWIMRFIRSRSSINYGADGQNHLSFMPEVEVFQEQSPQFLAKARQSLMKEFFPWMDNFVSLSLTQLVMKLQARTQQQMHQGQFLNQKHLGS